MKYVTIVPVLFCIALPCLAADEPTWVEIDNVVYGAKPDGRGPIGGAKGYANIVTKGDYAVKDLDALLDALSRAKAGQVVFVGGETTIDLTARIYIDQLVLEVPEGVTLAGNRGHGGSKGALLTSDALKTPVMIRAAGPGVRVTGLRIQGPNAKRYLDHHRRSFGQGGAGSGYYYKLPTSNGISTRHAGLEVDNCEISGFSHAGVDLITGDRHRIHHNYIHHCQYQGLGYGVCHNTASSLIEIYNNTFRATQTPVVIRGVPQDKCHMHHNWFVTHSEAGRAVRSSGGTRVFDNVYAEEPAPVK